MSIVCPTCGQRNPDGTEFCSSCGALLVSDKNQDNNADEKIDTETTPAADPYSGSLYTPPVNGGGKKKGGKKPTGIIAGILVAAVAVGGAAAGIKFYNNRSVDDTEEGTTAPMTTVVAETESRVKSWKESTTEEGESETLVEKESTTKYKEVTAAQYRDPDEYTPTQSGTQTASDETTKAGSSNTERLVVDEDKVEEYIGKKTDSGKLALNGNVDNEKIEDGEFEFTVKVRTAKGSKLNMRKSADTSSKVLVGIPTGTEVKIEKTKDGFGYATVKIGGKSYSGWISLNFVIAEYSVTDEADITMFSDESLKTAKWTLPKESTVYILGIGKQDDKTVAYVLCGEEKGYVDFSLLELPESEER